jgi:hypothetical protein
MKPFELDDEDGRGLLNSGKFLGVNLAITD